MGVISMQMTRQYNSIGQSMPRPSSSRKLSNTKKRRFAVYPPKQYPSVDMHSSYRNRRFSSPSHQSSIEGRPPRHPPLSSSLSLPSPSLSDALHIPNEIVCTKSFDLIIDEYKNEKFTAEILARLQRRRLNEMYNCDASTSTNDSDKQRDEDNEEYTTSSSNDSLSLGFSDTSEEGEEEPMGQTKESIFEFITKRFVRSIVRNTISKRKVGSLVKSKENENEDTTDNKNDANEEEVSDIEQNKVLSNETFRLLLSSQDANSSLRTKESSERQEERVSVFEIDFEYLDIGH